MIWIFNPLSFFFFLVNTCAPSNTKMGRVFPYIMVFLDTKVSSHNIWSIFPTGHKRWTIYDLRSAEKWIFDSIRLFSVTWCCSLQQSPNPSDFMLNLFSSSRHGSETWITFILLQNQDHAPHNQGSWHGMTLREYMNFCYFLWRMMHIICPPLHLLDEEVSI